MLTRLKTGLGIPLFLHAYNLWRCSSSNAATSALAQSVSIHRPQEPQGQACTSLAGPCLGETRPNYRPRLCLPRLRPPRELATPCLGAAGRCHLAGCGTAVVGTAGSVAAGGRAVCLMHQAKPVHCLEFERR